MTFYFIVFLILNFTLLVILFLLGYFFLLINSFIRPSSIFSFFKSMWILILFSFFFNFPPLTLLTNMDVMSVSTLLLFSELIEKKEKIPSLNLSKKLLFCCFLFFLIRFSYPSQKPSLFPTALSQTYNHFSKWTSLNQAAISNSSATNSVTFPPLRSLFFPFKITSNIARHIHI